MQQVCVDKTDDCCWVAAELEPSAPAAVHPAVLMARCVA